MKRVLFVVAVMAAVLTSCGGGPTLIGKWKLDSVSGEQLTAEETEGTMEFKEDGTWESKRGEMSIKGEWTLSDDKKTLTTTTEGREEVLSGVEITETNFSFKDGSDVITFKRVD
jgi:hypothetical protein